jgi:metallo-beta-lactamase family protein
MAALVVQAPILFISEGADEVSLEFLNDMQLTFWGAAQAVTGSMHGITVANELHILDCGLLQGHRKETFEINSHLPFDAMNLRSVVLSHAHLDHSGNLPTLTRNGFSGKIHATPATAELCQYMLADSAHIQESDAEYLSRRTRRRQAIGVADMSVPVAPLYTAQDAANAMRCFVPSKLYETTPLNEQLTFTFGNAGHILGSAFVLLRHQQNGRETKLLFSGDLGRAGMPILKDPDPAPEADFLIIESTYGNRIHQPISNVEAELKTHFNKTVARGGHVIVPAFAVGRTQQIVLVLHKLAEEQEIPAIPIFVDSPLAVNVTEVFRHHPEEYDREAAAYLEHGLDPFGFKRLRYLRDVADSKTLNDLRTPFVVISASGMCEGGRVLHHLRHGIADGRNLVLLAGYQAENTLGRRIMERRQEVRIFDEMLPLRAEVATLAELSAHADQAELIRWIQPIAGKLKRVFLVHGEPEGQAALAKEMQAQLGVKVHCPARGESFALSEI